MLSLHEEHQFQQYVVMGKYHVQRTCLNLKSVIHPKRYYVSQSMLCVCVCVCVCNIVCACVASCLIKSVTKLLKKKRMQYRVSIVKILRVL
jgi:hypothetical protein